jgi:segregation and condensation protein B
MERKDKIKSALESLMFVWGDPLEVKPAAEALGITPAYAKECFNDLKNEYDDRTCGLMIREINGKYQFCTRPENESYIAKLCTPVKERKLSNAAMEVLAIVAYRQPVSKSEIEYLRGIKCDQVIDGLQKKGLIEECGRGTGFGRPVLFGTTGLFLEKFGISTLDELPAIEEISDKLL